MTRSSIVDQALEAGALGQRLDREQAMALGLESDPGLLHELGRAAMANRRNRYGLDATYVFNVQINPSNICSSRCSFCDYAADPDDPHAYSLDEDEILGTVERAGATEAHIVGGLNTVWPYERNLELVCELRRRFPDLHIKGFTAVEIAYFSRMSGKGEEAVLRELKDAGLNAMPGGGAEIFSERLHNLHWSNKVGPKDWLRIHALAHSMDLPTNATLLFGFEETPEERVEHLLRLREAQDESGGFECFIPLAYQPGKDNMVEQGPTPLLSLSMVALSRLVLDNVPHIKSYWPMLGMETGAAGLSFGADDMDGTIREERIAHLAGAASPKGLAREQMEEGIRMGGFTPVERDGRFRPMYAEAR